jgi:phage shock protein C
MADGFRSLRRSRTDRKIAGVIGGLAQLFDLSSTPLRIAYVLVSILSAAFPGIFVYLLLWVLIPEAEQRPGRSA